MSLETVPLYTSLLLSLTLYFHTLQCYTAFAFAAGWAKMLIAGCRRKMIVMGRWGRGTPGRDRLVLEWGLPVSLPSAGNALLIL